MVLRRIALVLLAWALPVLWGCAALLFHHIAGDWGAWHWLAVVGWTLAVAGVSVTLSGRMVADTFRRLLAEWTDGSLQGRRQPPYAVAHLATSTWGEHYDPLTAGLLRRSEEWVVRLLPTWRETFWLLIAPVLIPLAVVLPPLRDLLSAVAVRLLGPSTADLLGSRVESLEKGRTDLTRAQQTELYRLERNLHDGAQARLVSIGMTLGAAEALVDRQPPQAKELIGQARESSHAALQELRELVRGILPPVLVERGLADAVRALALDVPLPVTVHGTITRRLEAPLESAVYFAVAELLANAVEHAEASGVRVTFEQDSGRLTVVVEDDGRGGANPQSGSGLAGVEERLGWFDGTLRISSPRGGPTRAVVEVPCA
ncbi:sensor histidine kinase [Nesterenkonia alba]|uniref:sensor histidine kinase n=1 Tax=Nesterenkonia alba TaxID=515814 RepID=UPI0003F4B39C|nr:histidine kinase [Nesterenkonia alba]